MVTNVGATLAVFCLLSGSLSSVDAWRSSYQGAVQDVLWSSQNCNLNGGAGVVHGTVTDAICCNNTVSSAGNKCKDVVDKDTCEAEDTCKWKKGMGYWGSSLGQGKCVLNRDRKNNVCCQEADIKMNCVDMMAGRCPKNWQLPGDCCPAPYNKYAGILSTDPTQSDLVCCNAPCKALESAWAGSEGNLTAGIAPVPGKAHCSADQLFTQRGLAKKCAPGERGYMEAMMSQYGMGSSGGYGGGYGGGMDTNMLSQLMGMPVSKPQSIGQIIPGMGAKTGLDGGLTLAALQNMGFGSSKDNHVDEITVDDFFDAIIESLDNDKDVFEYNKEINSDSWFGKQSFGGLVDGFSFIDPSKFLNQIYGSPFGLSNAQAMYGMQYGISQDKFKTPESHHTMTGFQPYASPYGSPYGSPSPYGAPPSPYGAPTPYGPPTPPAYAPPTPPAYAPPQYNPHGPPPPAQPAYPEQPPAYTEAPAYPTEAPPAYPEATSEQPAYTEAPAPAYPQDPYHQQPQHYPQPQYDYYGQQPYGAPAYPTQGPYHPTQAPYQHPTQAPYHPTQAPHYYPTHGPSYEYPAQPQYHQQPSYGQLPGYGGNPGYAHPTQAPYHPQPAYGQPASYGAPPPAYPQEPAYPQQPAYPEPAPVEPSVDYADYDEKK